MRWWWSEHGAGRIDVVIRGAGVLVVAGVLAGGGAYVIQDEGGEEGGFTTANLWISEDGGPCTYSASAVEFNASTDCDTFDEAYDAIRSATGATCGGRVLIKAGSYPEEEVTGYRNNCPTDESGMTLFAPESYDCDLEEYPTEETDVVITGGAVQPGDGANPDTSNPALAAGHVTFCGLTMEVGNVTNTNDEGDALDVSRHGLFIRGSRYITYKRSIFGGFAVFMTGFDEVNTGSGHIDLLYNNIGPCHEYSEICGNGKMDIFENGLIEGNNFHDYRSLENCLPLPSAIDCGHHEMMFLNGTVGLTIKRNRFFNYEHSGAVYTTCSGPDVTSIVGFCHADLLIENNWFESPHNLTPGEQDPGQPSERGEAAIRPGHCEGKGGTDLDNVVIRNNTVVGQQGEVGLSSGGGGCVIGSGGFHVTGNISNRVTSTDGCSVTNLTMDYNIGTIYSSNGSNPCGSNEHNGTLATAIMNNSTWGSLSQDMHLSSGSTIASGFVPEALCPDDDYDGDARPAGACDAGADER